MSLIARVERITGAAKIVIYTKHFRVFEFKMPLETDANSVAASLTSLAAPGQSLHVICIRIPLILIFFNAAKIVDDSSISFCN